MNNDYARQLSDPYLISTFLKAIGFDGATKYIIPEILEGEKDLKQYGLQKGTHNAFEYREEKYRSEDIRWKLRNKIVNELFTTKRLNFDDSIRLGKGGALPTTAIQKNKQAMIIIGLPASGKSSFAHSVSNEYGAVIIDSDFAKRKFPEYKRYKYGAALLHVESDSLTNICAVENKPVGFKTLFEKCIENDCNIVIPKIGHNAESVEKLAKKLKDELGYSVHLTLVSLDRKKATLRALERYKQTKRYVSLALIFDQYGNEPTLSYFRLKGMNNDLFESFGEISTDVPRKSSPVCIECINDNPSKLFKYD